MVPANTECSLIISERWISLCVLELGLELGVQVVESCLLSLTTFSSCLFCSLFAGIVFQDHLIQ
jgi:hypothetical protein